MERKKGTYYDKNIDKCRKYHLKYASEHVSEARQRTKEWQIRNKERVKIKNKMWCLKDPERRAATIRHHIGMVDQLCSHIDKSIRIIDRLVYDLYGVK